MAIGDYTKTTYVNGSAPALNATNLNNAEDKIAELTSAMMSGGTKPIGEVFMMEFDLATSASFPAVPRNSNIDLTLAQWPDYVPLLRAHKAKFNGVSDFTVTVSGSTVTFPNTTEAISALRIMKAEAVVANWQNGGEIANFTGGELYTGTGARRCVNVAGTDYEYTAVDDSARTITVVGSPTTGTQTAIFYPFRIAGSTGARLFKIAGFAPVAAGDAGIEVVGGYRRMDRGQGHSHGSNIPTAAVASYTGAGSNLVGPSAGSVSPSSDGTNGTPRTGKTTDPRTAGMFFYSWGGRYVA